MAERDERLAAMRELLSTASPEPPAPAEQRGGYELSVYQLGSKGVSLETGKQGVPHPAPPSGQSSPPTSPPQEIVGAEAVESVHLKQKRGASARTADGGDGEKESSERDEMEDKYLGAEVHALESGERDPEDWLTLSPTELLEHTGEQGWDEIFAAVREKQINQEKEANSTASRVIIRFISV